ncbi:MAG: hypothetical protein IPJ77_06780 [Planctomycetes bacterium]|nr:hypothetical protein [Planctomycetota bacterium]
MHRPLLLGSFVFVLALLALFARAAVQAGTARKLDLTGLVDGSELVLEGRVLDAQPALDTRGRPATRYTLSVARTFRGAGAPVRDVVLPGGVLPDGRGLVLPGVPVLTQGEEALLFLSRESRAGVRLPVGLSQGHLRIVRAPNGARRLVREHGDLELVDGAGRALPPPPAQETFDYAAVVAQVEAACVARAAAERSSAPARGGRR